MVYITPAIHTQLLSMKYAHIIYNPLTTINLSAIITNTNTDYNKKLLNIAKIYTNEAKYSICNDNFTFKLTIFYDICSKADILSETKMKIFYLILKSLALDYSNWNISISSIAMNFNQI